MPVINIVPYRNEQTCSISEDGTVSFPQKIVLSLGWTLGTKIAVSYIAAPFTVLLRTADAEQPGFTLSALSATYPQQSGGKIKCRTFAKIVARSRVTLPVRGLQPIILEQCKFRLALMAQSPNWIYEDFSQAGGQNIATDVQGIYELVDWNQNIVRIGEGVVISRFRQHLKDERFVNLVNQVRYFAMSDKEETKIMEKILLTQYFIENGELPKFNRIRA